MIRAGAPRATHPFPPQTQDLEYALERNQVTTFVAKSPPGLQLPLCHPSGR